MAHQITLIPGDGIGPEVAAATSRAVEATGATIEWEQVEAGAKALHDYGQLLPDEVFASLEVTRVGLKGPTATPIGGGHASINVALRKKLGLKSGKVYTVDATQIAVEEIGRAIPNTPMMGALMKAMPILKLETILHDIEKKFKSKGEQIVQGNFRAIRRAFEEVKVG